MADLFLGSEAKSLFSKRRILFFGDSNMRAMYKDLLWMIQNETFIPARNLKSKMEQSYVGDCLVRGSALSRGRDFEEEREFKDKTTNTYIKFTFITKCFSDNMIRQMKQVKAKEVPAPDVIVMNSCLWDVSRWGPKGMQLYQENMQRLVNLWIECIPPSCLIIWTTALPLALGMRGGGFLVKQVDFLTKVMPYAVMEANLFAQQMIGGNGFDVLDLSYHLRLQIHRRSMDGIHWEPVAVRHATNLLLTHITVSWGKDLPGRSRPHAWRRMEEGLAALKPRADGPAAVDPVVTENRGTKRKASDEEENVNPVISANGGTKRKATEEAQTTSDPAEPKPTASKKRKHSKPPNKYWKLKMNKRDEADIPGHARNSKPPVKENPSRPPPVLVVVDKGVLTWPLGATNNTRVSHARSNDSHSSRHQSNSSHRHAGGHEHSRHHSHGGHQHASHGHHHHQSHGGPRPIVANENVRHPSHGGQRPYVANETIRHHSNGSHQHASGYGNHHHHSHGGHGHAGGNGNNHNYGNASSGSWSNNTALQHPPRHHQDHRHENRRPHAYQGRHR